MLLRREIEEIVCIQIDTEPKKNDHRKCDEAGAIFHRREEGDQENPESYVVDFSDKRKWMKEFLLC